MRDGESVLGAGYPGLRGTVIASFLLAALVSVLAASSALATGRGRSILALRV